MNWKARLLYPQNWNIGFVNQSVEDLIEKQKLEHIRWMKHSYRDRWFADPFIYKVTEEEIIVFVEECQISDNPKGILCELHVDKKSMRLRDRYVLLELDTHLSYPAIIEKDGVTYVYPENGASGSLKMYKYDEQSHRLVEPTCILNEAVADSTIIFNDNDGRYYLIATQFDNSQQEAFLYRSGELSGLYLRLSDNPVQLSTLCSRPAGNWVIANSLYRPAQDCSKRYGGAISMMKVDSLERFNENRIFTISPKSYRYNRGIHTINFSKDKELIVIDGYGYLHPLIARLWGRFAVLKQSFLK